MKHCPQCQTSYTDESLKYCTRDGAPLENSPDAPTIAFNEEATVVSSRRVEPIRAPIENPPPQQNWQQNEVPPQSRQRIEVQPQQQNWQQNPPSQPPPQPPVIVAAPPEVKKSRTGLAVGLTALAMLALFGVAGALYFSRDRKTEVAVNVNAAPPAVNRPAVNQTATSNQNLNANAAVVVPPTATPTPKPTVDPEQTKTIAADVGNVVDNWTDASENLDIDAHLSNYANTVDYYTGGKMSLARVRADKQRAFDAYNTINFNISNVKITPDATGEKAVAVFDKEWTFEGDEKSSSGKVLQQLTLSKIGGRWLITGERDLKTYYVNN